MNKKMALFIALVFVTVFCSFAMAEDAAPCADTEFASVTTVLKSTKQVSFRAITNNVKSSISVTACWLEKEGSDGSWFTVCALTSPSSVSEDAFTYSATVDYSKYIGTGNYRIRATYNADGHAITRYSNERTF